jgi:hypothetical protein
MHLLSKKGIIEKMWTNPRIKIRDFFEDKTHSLVPRRWT